MEEVCRSATQTVPSSSGRQADKIIFDESNHQIWRDLGLAVMQSSNKVDVSINKQHKINN